MARFWTSANVLTCFLALLCQAQSDISTTSATAATTKGTIASIEDMGLSLLSSILSPSATPTSITSTNGSASPTSTSPTVAKPIDTSNTLPSFTNAASSATTTASSTAALMHSNRNQLIITGTLLSALVVVLLAVIAWLCCSRRRQKRAYARRPTTTDERNSWRRSAPYERPMSQQRLSRERYYSIPQPTQSQRPVPQPRTLSTYGLLPDANPFEDPNEYSNHPAHRHSSDTTPTAPVVAPQTYAPYKKSSQSLEERSSTPLFGNGRAAGESNQPWIPPPRNPHRPRSLPRSPLANEFDFGFQSKKRPDTRRMSERLSSNSSGTLSDAHQRF